ncbi:nuclear transport factor 2 family protein [Ferruginibacter sp. HRS2-29]|uniref:nuclear transport factor 2 family protein n=1 Tax=Ferruginibacter sp. HRS2-29 TaxID=2487334 RepID=UPI0020CE6EDE|nr:nuclear transport factor 2 family protein [Ferruginibacter sp. HRS2-29]MCP9749629.1 nuclear transport factor 2 family protein [Ferruginibacter sp. HRS2-29]
MKTINILSIFSICLLLSFSLQAQSSDSTKLLQLNQQIDNFVVQKDTSLLKTLYADDFVFSHGSGNIDNKASWLKSVAKGGFTTREHDSVKVELHPGVAILRGRLSVQKKSAARTDNYFLKYVRVYAMRKEAWEMVSHFTFYEEHEKSIVNSQ